MTEKVDKKRKSTDSHGLHDQPPDKKQKILSDETHDVGFKITADSLQMNYNYLKNELESQEVIDHLHKCEAFQNNILEECKDTRSRFRRNDLLLKAIYHTAVNKDNTVLDLFAEALVNTGQKFIIELLKKKPSVLPVTGRSRRCKVSLLFQQVMETCAIEPRDFIDDLVENNVMTFHDHEDVTRLEFRKKRVTFILKLARSSLKKYRTILTTVKEKYPKAFEDFKKRATKKKMTGAAVNIKMNMSSQRKDKKSHNKELRQIEENAVLNFNDKKQERNVMINDLVKNCRNVFEGLKISSIVIQLLAQDEDSIITILNKIQNGKAVEWLLSMLDENDRRHLSDLDVTDLQVSVSMNIDGNLSSLIVNEGCLCQLNNQKIKEIKDSLTGQLIDIDMLLTKIDSHSASSSNLLHQVMSSNDKFESLLDYMINEEVPAVWYCLLEEHLKINASNVLTLHKANMDTDTELNRNDIERHEELLKNELELRSITLIIRKWKHKKYVDLLEKLDKCSSRGTRIAEFLKFLLQEEDLTWFWEQVKEKQPYIWETIITSKRSARQSQKDVLAVRLMNDTVVEEVDAYRLKTYLSEQTINDLGFRDFENIQDRKLATQYILNRVTADTIGEFIVALRQAGYDHIYRQIKAGSLAEQYTCTRIHDIKRDSQEIFNGCFDLSSVLGAHKATTKKHTSLLDNEPSSYIKKCKECREETVKRLNIEHDTDCLQKPTAKTKDSTYFINKVHVRSRLQMRNSRMKRRIKRQRKLLKTASAPAFLQGATGSSVVASSSNETENSKTEFGEKVTTTAGAQQQATWPWSLQSMYKKLMNK